MDRAGTGPSGHPGDDQASRQSPRAAPTWRGPGDPAGQPPPGAADGYQPTQAAAPGPGPAAHRTTRDPAPGPGAAAYQTTQAGGSFQVPSGAAGQGGEVLRYGPGVPATPPPGTSQTAERIWRTGRPAGPPARARRPRRVLGSLFTALLLIAAAVVLYLRFHHAPFHDTAVRITQQTRNGCGVNVTGRIGTNGSPGTVSYQWVFRGDPHPPQPLTQSVVSGQDAVYVTVAVEGSGHGSASQDVTLQVLGPDQRSDSAVVTLSC
jgi:hypothetical protein